MKHSLNSRVQAWVTASLFTLSALTGQAQTPTFNDEFNSLDVSGKGTWQPNLSWVNPDGKNDDLPDRAAFFVNPNYAPLASANPFSASGGVLDISVKPTPSTVNPADVNYKSYVTGLLQTAGKFSQLYGYFEMRAKLPAGNGLRSAFWLLPADGSWPPEIDVLENLGEDVATVYQTLHTSPANSILQGWPKVANGNYSTSFHTYGVDWEKDYTTFYVDGQQTARYPTPADMHKPMFLVLSNHASSPSNNWGKPVDSSTPIPAHFYVDYVRAYSSLPDLSSGGSPTPGSATPTTLRPADNPSSTAAGLGYSYYEATGLSALPDFAKLAPVAGGTVGTFDITPRKRDNDFAFRYTGYVKVPQDGTYTFYTSSDDGSQLTIGSQVVVDNNGLHGSQERAGTIGLKAGLHAIGVTFFEKDGGQELSVSYSGPTVNKQVIPAAALSYAPAAPAGLASGGVYRLLARHSGKALDVAGNSTSNGAVLQQYAPNGTAAQSWVLTRQSDGAYTLTHQGTNQNLDVTGNGLGDGNAVTQYTGNTSDAQRWVITPTDGGYYKLLHKGTTKCLDVKGGETATQDGALVNQWEYYGNKNQQWKLERLDNAKARTTASRAVPLASVEAEAMALSAYPNPSHGQATLVFAAAAAQRVTVYMHDAQGHLVSLVTIPAQAGRTEFLLPSTLPQGTYFVRATVDGLKQHFILKVE